MYMYMCLCIYSLYICVYVCIYFRLSNVSRSHGKAAPREKEKKRSKESSIEKIRIRTEVI